MTQHAHFDLSDLNDGSKDSDNPFQPDGKLSREAECIIDALKAGKLSEIESNACLRDSPISIPPDDVSDLEVSARTSVNCDPSPLGFESSLSKEKFKYEDRRSFSTNSEEFCAFVDVENNGKSFNVEHVILPKKSHSKKKAKSKCCSIL